MALRGICSGRPTNSPPAEPRTQHEPQSFGYTNICSGRSSHLEHRLQRCSERDGWPEETFVIRFYSSCSDPLNGTDVNSPLHCCWKRKSWMFSPSPSPTRPRRLPETRSRWCQSWSSDQRFILQSGLIMWAEMEKRIYSFLQIILFTLFIISLFKGCYKAVLFYAGCILK